MTVSSRFFALAGLLVACAAGAQETGQLTPEQEVWALIIRQQGGGAALRDSTYGHGCRRRFWGGSCDLSPGVPADAWDSYITASAEPAALRDLLPANASPAFASDIGDESGVPCRRRRTKLQLSRVGFSDDGIYAVVSYFLWIPMDHLGCGAGSGATLLLYRTAEGEWVVDRPILTVVS
jgi:hypothetical protein